MQLLRYFLVFSILSLPFKHAIGQMWNGVDTLYGNEWIDFDQSYYKIAVGSDGLYRLDESYLSEILPANINANQIQLYRLGEQVPLHTSTDGVLNPGDYIEFIGKRNRTELDKYLFESEEDIFHPDFSYFSDTAYYFLTWNNNPGGLRFEAVDNDLSNPPTAEDFLFHTQIFGFHDAPIKSSIKVGIADVQQSFFRQAEGFCTGYTSNLVKTLSIEPGPLYDNGPPASMTVQIACRVGSHHQFVSINGQTYVEDVFNGYFARKHTFDVPLSELDQTTDIVFEGTANNSDKQAVSYISLTAPRPFDFENSTQFFFEMPASTQLQYLEISNFNTGGNDPILYDLSNGTRMQAALENGLVRIALPPSTNDRKLALISAAAANVITFAADVEFTDFSQIDPEYIVLFSRQLTTSTSGLNWVQEYVDYRNNNPYNSFSSTSIEIDKLYDQFSYGQQFHPISIRNFGHWAVKNWTKPQHLFIIGKGREYRVMRSPDQVDEHLYETFFVPTMGFPGSDNLLLGSNESAIPVFSIGRLAVTDGDQIGAYLDKVKAFEASVANSQQTIEDREWLKRVMHLGGGGDQFEQQTIKDHLLGMEQIIENGQFGGDVTSFYKTSSDPVETSQSTALKTLINDGIAILTFFGHSSPNTFDFNFDVASSYDNQDRYPVMFSFGCFSGQCHNDLRSIGEEFVLIENKGAIAFFASSGYGFIGSLDKFGDGFYSRLGGSMYGATFGEIHRSVIASIEPSNVVGDGELAQQSTLQGDPALRLHPMEGPDYLFDGSSVQLDPPLLNTSLDSFDMQFDVRNLGYHIPDTAITLEIIQELPSGEFVTLLDSMIMAPAYVDNLELTFPVFGTQSLGLNRYYLTIDARDDIDEAPAFAELNNEFVRSNGAVGLEVYIVSNDIRPTYPPEFSIVGATQPILYATTVDAFAKAQNFIIQLDTTATFDSPILTQEKTFQSGGILEWEPIMSWQNDLVYYWRVSPDSIDASGYRWMTSSFLYEGGGEPGWNQSHFYQFQKDTFNLMKIEEPARVIAFTDDQIDIRIRNTIYDFPAKIPRYYVNGVSPAAYLGDAANTVSAGVFIAVLDSVNATPIKNPGGLSWGEEYGPTNYRGFLFETADVNDRAEIINFLENGVADNQYVAFFTVQKTIDQDYLPEVWGTDTTSIPLSLYDALESYGATQVRSLENLGARPYALFFQKGNPGSFVENIGTLEDVFDLTSVIDGTWFEGSVFSPRIGPANQWENLQWEISGFEPAADSLALNLYGLRADDSLVLLHSNISVFDTTIQHIDAAEYPWIQLEYFASDEADRTPPNLEFWKVQFKGVPEAALAASDGLVFYADTLYQGETFVLDIPIRNISAYDMDSLLVHLRLTNAQNEETLYEQRLKPLLLGDSLVASLRLDTRNLAGPHILFIEANPLEDQPELTHINNLGLIPFRVLVDEQEPILDVTFDGVRIMNGDIVSAEPEIVLSLRDENEFLALSDTTILKMVLLAPDGSIEILNYNQPEIDFFAASADNLDKENQAQVTYRPRFQQDGVYTLYVEAADASGNQSGDLNFSVAQGVTGYDYKISFQIITKATISNVINYPNPFSTQTYFVYTLTGTEAPPRFKIQILTVSGRIVRELTQADLGSLKVGTHRTEIPWDGTDMFGDRLANGVYLYRVTAQKANGEAYEHYDTGADGFFQKGFGKLVIVR